MSKGNSQGLSVAVLKLSVWFDSVPHSLDLPLKRRTRSAPAGSSKPFSQDGSRQAQALAVTSSLGVALSK
ncbi:MAG: hypothetical protein ACKOAH_00425, partial [Pirellula sp.]